MYFYNYYNDLGISVWKKEGECVITKFGKVCVMQYGTNIGGFVSNHQYIRFVVPEGYKPNVYQASAGIIVSGNWALAGSCELTIDTNGTFSVTSTTSQSGSFTFIGQLVYICK